MIATYRPPTLDDAAFIMSTWLKSQRRQGDRVFMTNKTYFDGEKKRVTKLLERALVIVICDPEDSNHIFGFLAYSHNKLADLFAIHFAHLKKPYRNMGIMTALIKELYPRIGIDETAVTHVNDLTWKFLNKYKLTFNPFLEGYL